MEQKLVAINYFDLKNELIFYKNHRWIGYLKNEKNRNWAEKMPKDFYKSYQFTIDFNFFILFKFVIIFKYTPSTQRPGQISSESRCEHEFGHALMHRE